MRDVIIIGGGVIGCSTAYNLAKYNLNVMVIEKENDLAEGTSGANSAIIHAGNDPKEGSAKAIFNLAGNRMYEAVCEELDVELKKRGSLTCATSAEEEETLDQLKIKADEREIPCRVLTREEAIEIEPNLSDNVTKALLIPTTMTVDPWEITLAFAETAVVNGTEIHRSEKVSSIEKTEKGYLVKTDKGEYESKYVVNAAGVFADKISKMIPGNREFSITARKGEYLVLDREEPPFVEHIIYPVPGKTGKGVLAIPTVHGNVLIGPDSEPVEDRISLATETDRLNFIKREVKKTVKNVPYNKTIKNFAGLRATPSTGDFIIGEEENNPGFINVAGIESPGLSAAPAIGKHVAEIIVNKENAEERKDYKKRPKQKILSGLTMEEKNSIAAEDSSFAKIVCRCETITEGEIIDAIRRPVGALTVAGVRKRTRAGFGRCQGGFCQPKIIGILAAELGKAATEIEEGRPGSNLLIRETKEEAR